MIPEMFLEQQIRYIIMISEGSCHTDDLAAENTALLSQEYTVYILK